MTLRQLCCALILAGVLIQRAYGQEAFSPYIPALPGQSSPLANSVVPPRALSPGILKLGLKDTVDRAIKNNLAAVYSSEAERAAAARRLTELAERAPKINLTMSAEQRQVNLAAFGFSGFPGINQIIGPFGIVDMRAVFSKTIVDREQGHNVREATSTQRAAQLTEANTRELVVLTAVDLYFQALSAESRVTAVEAQLTRAKALHERASDLKSAGLVAGIDVVRAEVEERAAEQRLIQAKNAARKQKLGLARAIGMPLEQEFVLSDRLPEESPLTFSLPQLLEQGYAQRADARALEARVQAAEEALRAARAKGLPTVSTHADYGVIGSSPWNSHGTYSLSVELKAPLFDKKVDSEASEKEAALRERRAERDSLHGRIEFETRTALLDLESTRDQLQVARRSLALARLQLDQAQDRFSAGVADNLEVVQAQEALAIADEALIESLYGFNVARALLARATGAAERSVQEFLGKSPTK